MCNNLKANAITCVYVTDWFTQVVFTGFAGDLLPLKPSVLVHEKVAIVSGAPNFDEGLERLYPSRDKTEANPVRRNQRKRFCVAFLLCDAAGASKYSS